MRGPLQWTASSSWLLASHGAGMEAEAYAALVSALRAVPATACPLFRALARTFAVPEDTIKSIYGQEWQYQIKSQHSTLLLKLPALVDRFRKGARAVGLCRQMEGARLPREPPSHQASLPSATRGTGSSLLELAHELNVPACTLARRVLEHLDIGLTRPQISQALRNPAALASGSGDAALLDRLVHELEECVLADSVSGPAGDAARAAVGVEHERQLYERLNAAGIAYWPEDVLRDRGFFKTPDALLQVPIAVNGAVVHWIDSKATFGDSLMHR